MNKKKLLIATHNPAKLYELSSFLVNLPVELVTLSQLGINKDIEEDGSTYEENSQKKAIFYAKKSGLYAISDDGGIEISALNNEPGVHSKRWLGGDAKEEDLVKHMLKIAKDLPDENRNAKFKVVISLASPKGKAWSVMGEVKGIIAKKPFVKELKGYPYRSFFYLPKIKKYYFETELTSEEQKKYNHRLLAIKKLKPLIKKELRLV